MTQKPDDTELDLETYFKAELATGTLPSADLIAAVLSDAEKLQPALAGLPVAPSISRPIRQTWWRDFWDVLGGWGAVGALSACLALGVTLGYTPPQGLTDLTDAVLESAGFSVADNDDYTLDELMLGG